MHGRFQGDRPSAKRFACEQTAIQSKKRRSVPNCDRVVSGQVDAVQHLRDGPAVLWQGGAFACSARASWTTLYSAEHVYKRGKTLVDNDNFAIKAPVEEKVADRTRRSLRQRNREREERVYDDQEGFIQTSQRQLPTSHSPD